MKNFQGVFKIKVLLMFLLLLAANAFSQENKPFSINESPLPAPTGFINDFAGVIDAATKQRLEERLTNFKKTTDPPIELAVAIVRTTGERPIFEYSLAVARGWGIGAKADDNPSALLFVAIDDRKYYTQVSRDLEDELPDALVGQLQRQNLVPAFKQGNYSKGVEDTIEAYIRTIGERTSGTVVPTDGQTNQPPRQQPRQRPGRSLLSNVGCCLIGLIILLILIFSRSGRSGGGRGGWGGGGGGFGGGSALPWIIGSIIANSAASRGSSWGGSSDWGGGGSSGGGWGGFGGGGDFGGGGAGGDW